MLFRSKESWDDSATQQDLGTKILFPSKPIPPIPKQIVNKMNFMPNALRNKEMEFIKNTMCPLRTESSTLCTIRETFENLKNSQLYSLASDRNIKRPSSNSLINKKRNMNSEIVFMKKHMKDSVEFNHLILSQQLNSGNSSIWTAKFSQDGNFFATGSEDGSITIWKVGDFSHQCYLFNNK